MNKVEKYNTSASMFRFIRSMLVFSGVFFNLSLLNVAAEQANDKNIKLYGIAVPDKIEETDGYLVILLLKNESNSSISVVTSSGFDEIFMSKVYQDGTALVTVNPPPHEEFSKMTGMTEFKNIKFPKEIYLPVVLNPGQHTRMQAAVWIETQSKEFKIKLKISEEFTKKYEFWSGELECRPTFLSKEEVDKLKIMANTHWRQRVWINKK